MNQTATEETGFAPCVRFRGGYFAAGCSNVGFGPYTKRVFSALLINNLPIEATTVQI